MTYQDALDYLESFVDYERMVRPDALRRLTLERMRRLCRRLGDPQRRFRAVQVAGTNGKGAVSAMLYAMLKRTPLRAGLYTSPHLEDLRERIRVWPVSQPGGDPQDDRIGRDAFAALVEEMRPVLEQSRNDPDGPVTYFEVMTALAFHHFCRAGVDVAVLEVGLGGRLDATSVAEAAVAVFTPIGLDHTEVLGETLAAIAAEKAAVIRHGQLAVSAPQEEDVEEVLRMACGAHGVPLTMVGWDVTADVTRHDLSGLGVTVFGRRGMYETLDLPLLGRHQADNAATAVAALEALSAKGSPFSAVRQGLPEVVWPGRLELVSDSPCVLMDGAHNPPAALALRRALEELVPGRAIHLLIGMSSDKRAETFGSILAPLSSTVTCTRTKHARAMDAGELSRRLAPLARELHTVPQPADALTYLLNAAAPDDVILVTGSMFLVGELRQPVRQAAARLRRKEANHIIAGSP
ncbi:MAG TPA: folylpolyglutamate synthase/dihydrofolate synthase family protein [bacterium]